MGLRIFFALFVIGSFAFAPVRAEDVTTPPDEARLAAARDLMEVTGVTRQMDGMVDAMSQGFKRGAQSTSPAAGDKAATEFEAMMKKFLGYKDEMLKDFAVLYAETFTAEEMKTVADFYRTGAGAKFINLTPQLMQKGAAIGMKYSERMIKEMQQGGPKP